jgi:hypothetical protein
MVDLLDLVDKHRHGLSMLGQENEKALERGKDLEPELEEKVPGKAMALEMALEKVPGKAMALEKEKSQSYFESTVADQTHHLLLPVSRSHGGNLESPPQNEHSSFDENKPPNKLHQQLNECSSGREP